VDRYGNFVTYDPPLTPATVVLWGAPIILILFGVLFVFRRKQSQTLSVATKYETATTTALSEEEQQRLNELLNKENNK
jgi:cytochrome c-type biogenesis protein ccmH